ncbi:MAG: proline--tRNA ligase [Bacillales bacterium]|jgi:prolyl-tRNA synthetase|nr:proline--tRNA ligase [Bacillales bacterium]
MRQSNFFAPTLREVPADADTKSQQLLLRAGYIRQNAAGIYSYLPLGLKVLKNIENIVRDEMDKAGAVELLMPALAPAELWMESERWFSYGPELMRMKDRHNRDFALGATHEEVVTDLIRNEINTYKKLPLTVYQIQNKFRDEKRPRFGLLRGREFLMKDAYSFHSNKESLDDVYNKMFTAYSNVFTRLGLNFRAVIADSGAMGGKDTHEFMVLSEIGEDTIAYSDTSSYAANIEMAPCLNNYEKSIDEILTLEEVETIDKRSIEDVASYLGLETVKCFKSMLFKVDEKFVLVLARGDHEVNDIKLKNLYSASNVELATEEDAKRLLGANFGSLGPINIDTNKIDIVADNAVAAIVNACCGANKNDYHYTNVNINRDYKPTIVADIRFIKEGDASPDGQGIVKFAKGIEVGHIFKLGTRYSEYMKANFLDENGKQQPMIMGCYGIGVSRLISAIAETCNDEKGLVWPNAVAPFDVHVVVVNPKDQDQKELGEKIYENLMSKKCKVLLDDRNERPGVKFADADLIGIPVRVTIGKKSAENIVEFKQRTSDEVIEITVEELYNKI